GQGFADKRKRKAKYEYMKILKKEKNKIRDEAAGSSKQNREDSGIRKERGAAMEQYTKKKRANYKKMCKKTQRGQPLMRERIELLLSKIENKYNQT
ncbi:hypothetical protein FSP39_013812, partial [Pinctada imbricata]